ncbi:flagellar protein FlaG [Desemzia sp. C1]|uniref:flagellar protein FlaG n=1 Tax=Desemzia sp. C1 TaxID=2892016 RepID=UPI001E470F55|nr:flagellar protein FlaG [Desemzia sp. C1]
MTELNFIQASKLVTAIENKPSTIPVSYRQNEIETQLQYDEAEEKITMEQLEKAVNKANEHIMGVNTQLQYRIHEGTDRIMVRLIDTESQDVIREIPPEKMLDLVAEIWKRVGLVVDKQK